MEALDTGTMDWSEQRTARKTDEDTLHLEYLQSTNH